MKRIIDYFFGFKIHIGKCANYTYPGWINVLKHESNKAQSKEEL